MASLRWLYSIFIGPRLFRILKHDNIQVSYHLAFFYCMMLRFVYIFDVFCAQSQCMLQSFENVIFVFIECSRVVILVTRIDEYLMNLT